MLPHIFQSAGLLFVIFIFTIMRYTVDGFSSYGMVGNFTDATLLLQRARDYRHGRSVRQDFQASEWYYNQAILRQVAQGDQDTSDTVVEFVQLLEENHGSLNSSYDAFSLIRKAAAMGNADAQFKLATIYGSGIYTDTLAPMDSGRSLLLYYVAALSGSPEANIAVAYRFANGIGVPESCELARKHYEYAANIVAKQLERRGYGIYAEKRKLSEDSQHSASKRAREVDDEIVDYYKHLSSDGDAGAALSLATMYLSGSRVLDQDFDQAIEYLRMSSRENTIVASGLLGYLLIQGFGSPAVSREFGNGWQPVIELLSIAAKHRDANAIVGLGIAYQRGLGVIRNTTRSIELYQSVLTKHQDAGFLLGELYMGGYADGKIDIAIATQAYASASQKGNTLALHRLGHMSSIGLGLPKHCPTAVSSLKAVAERGDWMAGLTEAHRRYYNGDHAVALMLFSRFAALGEESAQFNVADILSKHYCPDRMTWQQVRNRSLEHPFLALNISRTYQTPVIADGGIDANSEGQFISIGVETDGENWLESATASDTEIARSSYMTGKRSIACQTRALQFYGLSASQNDAEAMLRIGDMHYYGLAGLTANKIEAARFYQFSADLRNPHANFNLGVMYEAGDGVDQDFHLAKRFFDQAADFDPDARLPRSIAVFLLSNHQDLLSWLGADEVNRIIAAVSPTFIHINDFFDHTFTAMSRFISRWLRAQRSSIFSVSHGIAKPGYRGITGMSNLFRYALDMVDNMLEFGRYIIIHSILLVVDVMAMVTQQPSVPLDQVMLALEQGSNVVTELENYLIITLALMLLFVVERYRKRRRDRRRRNAMR